MGRSAGEGGPPTPALRSWSSSVVISPPGAPGRRAAGGDEPGVDLDLQAACVGQQGCQEQQKPRGPEMDRRGSWWLFWWLLGTQLVGVAPVPDGRNGKDLQPRVAFEEDAQVSDSQAVSR